MHKLKVEFSKFTVVGAVNFVFTFVLFYLMVKVFNVNYLVSLAIVSLLGMIITYSANYVWVFKTDKRLSYNGRLLKYILAGVASIAFNAIVLKFIVDRTGYDPFYVQAALIPMVVVFNFSTAKFWSLKATKE